MTIGYKKPIFAVGDLVRAMNIKPHILTDITPPLIHQEDYRVIGITLDNKGNQHLDLGLTSKYEYISSRETGEHLPQGNVIHWCHPSRFIKIIR